MFICAQGDVLIIEIIKSGVASLFFKKIYQNFVVEQNFITHKTTGYQSTSESYCRVC